jgi:hypothetical protein
MTRRTKSYFSIPSPTENVENQIDRLNQAVQATMKEIELSSVSRNPSRLSGINRTEGTVKSSSSCSEEILYDDLEDKIEGLLLTIDRNEMIIEDYKSQEVRRLENPQIEYSIFIDKLRKENLELRNQIKTHSGCTHGAARIRKEIWLQPKTQKKELLEKERKNFEEKLEVLDNLIEEYSKKNSEIILEREKINVREKALDQKEKDIRAERIAFDKHKTLLVNGSEIPKNSTKAFHNRGGSYSIPSLDETGLSLISPKGIAPTEKITPLKVPTSFSSKLDELKFYQTELKRLENDSQSNTSIESRLDIKIDQLRNKVATLRGEIAISESTKATKIINNMLESLKKDSTRDYKKKRSELLERIKKTQNPIVAIEKIVPLANKVSEINNKPLNTEENNKKSKILPKVNDESHPKSYFDTRRKALNEKEIPCKDLFLQQASTKIPGASNLIENVNLSISRFSFEKNLLDKQKEAFEREKIEWTKHK